MSHGVRSTLQMLRERAFVSLMRFIAALKSYFFFGNVTSGSVLYALV